MNKHITIVRPDDWHVHLRDGKVLSRTVADSSRYFGRIIVMPNLSPPLTEAAQIVAYYERIMSAYESVKGKNNEFQPLMTIYLTTETTPAIIEAAAQTQLVYGAKLYPSGTTTHSDAGVTDLEPLFPVFETMEKLALPLLLHGESNAPEVDVFDREKHFIDQHLDGSKGLIERFPGLRIVLEHISCRESVDFIRQAPSRTAATITPHHLLLDRNDLLRGGVRPHYYCAPILKRSEDQAALISAATSGHPSFFLGTDSAPHAIGDKLSSCGCAGIYSAHAALELYAIIFEQLNALDRLEAFASFYGADFYRLPRNTSRIKLVKHDSTVPQTLSFGQQQVVPLWAEKTLPWRCEPA